MATLPLRLRCIDISELRVLLMLVAEVNDNALAHKQHPAPQQNGLHSMLLPIQQCHDPR